MKNLILKNLIALTVIIAAVPAFAGDFRTKERLSKGAIGGESGGGGKTRILRMKSEEIEVWLKETLKERNKPNVQKPMMLNPDVFLFLQDKQTPEELARLKMYGYNVERLVDGSLLVRNGARDGYANEPKLMEVFGWDKIQDKVLKSALEMFHSRVVVNKSFIESHQAAFKEEFEKENPGIKFNINNYDKISFVVDSIDLDFLLTPVVIQNEGCLDYDGVRRVSATAEFKRFSPICFSTEMLAEIPERLLEEEVWGLYYHEIAHQYKIGEEGAELVQNFAMDEIFTPRTNIRVTVKSAQSIIESIGMTPEEYATLNAPRISNSVGPQGEFPIMWKLRDAYMTSLASPMKLLEEFSDQIDKPTAKRRVKTLYRRAADTYGRIFLVRSIDELKETISYLKKDLNNLSAAVAVQY